jgi:hypothetical protein
MQKNFQAAVLRNRDILLLFGIFFYYPLLLACFKDISRAYLIFHSFCCFFFFLLFFSTSEYRLGQSSGKTLLFRAVG